MAKAAGSICRLMVLLVGFGVAGCAGSTSPQTRGRGSPETVYIPGPDFRLDLIIRVPHTARAGEWVALKATRKSGPWVSVERSAVPAGVAPLNRPPSEVEEGVENNLSWSVEPAGVAEFSVPKSPAEGGKRSVRFPRAGEYRIWAVTSYPARGKSNVVAIRVEE